MTGKIKTLTDKGFGFLTVEGRQKDLFFHSKGLQDARYDDLQVGDVLEFDVEEGDKGAFANNITLVR